jgi:hypothetical protein
MLSFGSLKAVFLSRYIHRCYRVLGGRHPNSSPINHTNTNSKKPRAQQVRKLARQSRRVPLPIRDGGVVLSSGPTPFPPRLTAKCPWSYLSGLSAPGGGVTGQVTYRLNSPYDPDSAVGGGQAVGFDQLAVIYGFYRVVKAHVRIAFQNPSADDYWGGFRVRPSTASAGSLSYEQFNSLPFTCLMPLSTTGERRREYEFDVNINEMFGVTKSQLLDDPNFRAAVTTTPVNELYLDVVAFSAAGTPSATFTVDIVYDTIWTQRARLLDA